MSYSEDLRKRVVEGYLAGEGSIRGLAARYKVSKNTVVNWLKLHESTGGLTPRKGNKGRPSPLVGEVADLLIRLAVDDPDATRQLLCDRLEALTSVKSSLSAIGRFLKRNGLTYKKRRSMQQNRGRSALREGEKRTLRLPKDLRPKTSSSSTRLAPTAQ